MAVVVDPDNSYMGLTHWVRIWQRDRKGTSGVVRVDRKSTRGAGWLQSFAVGLSAGIGEKSLPDLGAGC